MIEIDEATAGEYKDTEDFQKLKAQCYEAATHDQAIEFGELPPPEYKYFSELYWLYNDMAHSRISEEDGRAKEQKNYKELKENKAEQERYLWACADWQNNIRIAGESVTALLKAKDKDAVIEAALEVVERLTHNEVIKLTVHRHLTEKENISDEMA